MHLLLDAGGTLIHPAEAVGAVYARHLGRYGLPADAQVLDQAFRGALEDPPDPDFGVFATGHAAEHAWWRDRVRDAFTGLGGDLAGFARSAVFAEYYEGLFEHYAAPSAWALFPDVLPFLEAAAGGARLAVLSNFDDRLAPVLEGLGIAGYFELILTSADAGARKPDRRIFDLVLRHLGAEPTETVHAGDSHRDDVLGARAAGIRPFHLRRPDRSLADFLDSCGL